MAAIQWSRLHPCLLLVPVQRPTLFVPRVRSTMPGNGNSETVTLNDSDVEKKAQAPVEDKQEADRASLGTDPGPGLSSDDPFLVQLEPEDNPCLLPTWRKWLAIMVISTSSLCATFASSVVRARSCRHRCARLTLAVRTLRYIGRAHGDGTCAGPTHSS